MNDATARCDLSTGDRPPLTDAEVLSTARLSKSVPAHIPEIRAIPFRRFMAAANGRIGTEDAISWFAEWPDGTYIVLAHNAQWTQPRAEQLLRAYRLARHFRQRIDAQNAPSGLVVSVSPV